MCTFNISLNDTTLEGAKRSFPTQAAITEWMEVQIERLLKQISVQEEKTTVSLRKITVSDRIKSLSSVPESTSHADYKDDIIEVLSAKY